MLVILVLFLSPIFLSIVIFLMSVALHIIIFVNYVKLGPLLTVTLPFFWLMLLFLLSLIIAVLSSIIFPRTLLVGFSVFKIPLPGSLFRPQNDVITFHLS